MEVIGLDVGFSKKRASSGVARLGPEGNLRVDHAMDTWESRVAITGTGAIEVAAMDAPYTRAGASEKRGCERVFCLGDFQKRCKPAFSHVPGTGQQLRKAGWETAQQLKSLAPRIPLPAEFPRVEDCNVVEAFPNTYLGVCLPDQAYESRPRLRRGQKFDWLFDSWVAGHVFDAVMNDLGLAGLENLRNECMRNRQHDERAALICLLTAAGVASGRYPAVGDEPGGYFFLPPWSAWAAWARVELDRQRHRQPGLEIWMDGERR